MGVFEQLQDTETKKQGGVFGRIFEKQNETRQKEFTQSAEVNSQIPVNVMNTPFRQALDKGNVQGYLAINDPNIASIRGRTGNELPATEDQLRGTEYTGTRRSIADRGASAASEFTQRAINSALLGIPAATIPGGEQAFKDTDTTAGKIGDIAGLIVPGAGAYKATAGLALRIAPNAGRIGQSAIRGATAGAAFSTAREGADLALDTDFQGSESLGKRAGDIGLETALFAGGDALFAAASPLVKIALQKLANRTKTKEVKEILALPEPKQRGQQNRTITEEIINIPETKPRGLPEASADDIAKSTNIQSAKNDIKEISNTIKELENEYEKAIVEQYQYLKNSIDNKGGVNQGKIFRDKNGDVIGRAGRTSENPKWYRDFFAENNRTPTKRELYDLAKKQVDEGFQDDFANVPSWKQENNYDETISALNQVKNQLESSVKELDNSVVRTNQLSKETTAGRKGGVFKQLDESLKIDPEVPKEPRVRDRLTQYLDEQEKAARERIQASRNRISSTPVDIYKDYAIIGAAKIGKGVIKFSEWSEQMVKEFGEEIRPRLRSIYEQSSNIIRQQTKEAQESLKFAEGPGDANTFRSKVAREQTEKKQPLREKFDSIRAQLVDDVAALERLEKNVKGKISPADKSLYKTARLFKGVPTKANEIVRTRFGPIIDQVEKAGFTTDDLGDYALAVQARDINARGLKSGFTNKEIDSVIQKYANTPLEQARQELVRINEDLLQDLVDAGVVSQEVLETLRARYPNYIPFFRSFDDDKVEFGAGLSQALANVSSPLKQLKGSERKVIDPLENMVRNVFQSTNAAERNRVASQLAKLADEPGAEGLIRRLKPSEDVGRKNVVSVMEGGQKVRYEVEPEVYKAMLSLDNESAGFLIDLFQKPASLLRAGATLTPEFSLRNPTRDVIQAYVVSNSGFNPITDFPIALIDAITKGQGIRIKGKQITKPTNLYSQFLQDNAGFGNIISMDRKVHQEALEQVIKQTPGKKFVNILTGRSLINVLRAIADVSETSVKLGEYRAALRQGQSRQEAAYRARDIMDFSRGGSKVRNVNKVVAFLNANIQGKSKLIRAIKENPVGVTARALKLITLPTVAVFALQKYTANDNQKQIIQDAPNWMRNSFWLLPIPGTDQIARIPKPFDLAPIFANAPERMMEYMFNNDPEAFDNFVRDSLSAASIPVMLTGLVPFIEGMANYSFFRQGPIIPQREQDIELTDQFDINTPESAKALANAFDSITGGKGMFKNFSSPRIQENLIRGLTAGLGEYANSAIDFFVKDLGKGVERAEKDISQKPLARAFLVNQNTSGRSMNQLYTLREKLTRERGSAKLKETEFAKETEYKFVKEVTDRIGKISKLMREIENSEKFSSKRKGELITELNKTRNELARNAMEAYRELEK